MNYHVAPVSIVAVAVCVGVIGSSSAAPKLKPGVTRGIFTHQFHQDSFLGTGYSRTQEIASVEPGEYIAFATATFESSDPQFHKVECAFIFGTELPRAGPSGDIGGDTDNHLTLPMTIGFVMTESAMVAVGCRVDAPNTVRATDGQISIIRVDELTTEGVPIVFPFPIE
jgi:hypothetical protein